MDIDKVEAGMKSKQICLIGGSGFVGRHLAGELTRRGYQLRVLTRKRERRRALLVFPTLELIDADVHDSSQLSEAIDGCDAVVNLAGILNEVGGKNASFDAVHAELPEKIVQACQEKGVGRLLHMSALNAAADAPSAYLRTKSKGEAAIQAASDKIATTIFRPSVIFGYDDSFFNRFALLLRVTPFVFPLACPKAKFAPAYVEDVVTAFADVLDDKTAFGQSYDLCGPDHYTLSELVEYTANVCGLNRKIWGFSDGMSQLQARALEKVPGKPFSTDNYRSMQVDCVCATNGFAILGIDPVSLESVVPRYLGREDRNARYQTMRSYARRQ